MKHVVLPTNCWLQLLQCDFVDGISLSAQVGVRNGALVPGACLLCGVVGERLSKSVCSQKSVCAAPHQPSDCPRPTCLNKKNMYVYVCIHVCEQHVRGC